MSNLAADLAWQGMVGLVAGLLDTQQQSAAMECAKEKAIHDFTAGLAGTEERQIVIGRQVAEISQKGGRTDESIKASMLKSRRRGL